MDAAIRFTPFLHSIRPGLLSIGGPIWRAFLVDTIPPACFLAVSRKSWRYCVISQNNVQPGCCRDAEATDLLPNGTARPAVSAAPVASREQAYMTA